MTAPSPSRSRQAAARWRALARYRRVFVEQLEDRSMLALVPQMVADINATPATVPLDRFFPNQIVDVGGVAYFSSGANVPGEGDLWRSDGTAAGTYLVKDIPSGFESPQIANLTNVGGMLFFTASVGEHGIELWKSDGTEEGTMLVKDIVPGPNSSNPTSFVDVNGTLFFVANDGTNGAELWKSDGTETGTILVKDIAPGLGSSSLEYLTSVNNTLFFSANDGVSGAELWRSDGTAEGTVLAADILHGPDSSNPRFFVNVNGTLFFPATDGVHGRELWKFDVATGDASLVKDINGGTGGSSPSGLIAVNGTLFFSATGGLWKSDGTSDGTVKIKDISTTLSMSAAVGNTLYFWTTTRDLWKSDGTPEGTQLVDGMGLIVTGLASVNGTLYYATNFSGVFGDKLLKTDPSTNIASVVREIGRGGLISNYPSALSNIGGKLFFSASDGAGQVVLWMSDGTAEGTHTVPSSEGLTASGAMRGIVVGDAVYVVANDGVRGTELWRSDGTSSGTFLLKDIISGPGSPQINQLKDLNGTLLFSGFTNSGRLLLWKSDGTREGTIAVGGSPDNPQCFQNVGDAMFFLSSNAVWKSDGASATMVSSATPTIACSSAAAGGLFYYTASAGNGSTELWRSDGTPAGTFIVKAGLRGLLNSSRGVAAIGSTLFFSVDDSTNGLELWRTDGTIEGTTLVKDISPGPDSSSPTNLLNINGTLHFFAKDETGGWGLWQSNGTSEGTVLVKYVSPVAGSPPDQLTNVNGRLFFAANDGVNGRELWISDGTSEGTNLLKDVLPGAASSEPRSLTNINGILYFSANDGIHGHELWRSDGTAAGTYQLSEIASGPASSLPSSIVSLNNTIVFNADDGIHGRELWKLIEINQAPVAWDDSFGAFENVSRTITKTEYLANDSDVDSSVLTAAVVDQPGRGSVELRLDGSFVYTPAKDYSGADRFTYRLSDGLAVSNVATITLNVVAVNNTPVVVLGSDVAASEGQFFVTGGSFSDADVGETWTASVDYGDGSGVQPLALAADKTVQLGRAYAENGSYTVTVSVRDSTQLVGTAALQVNVRNVEPQILAWGGPALVKRGEAARFVGSFNDPGVLDAQQGMVDWGDRSVSAATLTKTGGVWQVNASHTYASGGIYQAVLTVADDDGGAATQAATVLVAGSRLNEGTLEIVGSGQRDNLSLMLKKNALVVSGSVGGVKLNQAIPAASVQRIVVHLAEGNDSLSVDKKVTVPLLVTAGAGNDVVKAGGGAAVIIGGLGQDQLTGGGKSDLLIAGTTTFDTNHVALAAIFAEWSSGRPLAARTENLRNGTGPVLSGLNVALKTKVTVLDDTSVDKLIGGTDLDWFWCEPTKDKITGRVVGEVVN
jgi:ELWxxDGT repeat protein